MEETEFGMKHHEMNCIRKCKQRRFATDAHGFPRIKSKPEFSTVDFAPKGVLSPVRASPPYNTGKMLMVKMLMKCMKLTMSIFSRVYRTGKMLKGAQRCSSILCKHWKR